ncbi:hypothetical protein [Radiobacillus sp. PE A8.2]|uniref:hypothetical protein n=1 Tax=Radiobacillus sp. PE A8.2 TaxID=3380349 RepID=UPI003890C763
MTKKEKGLYIGLGVLIGFLVSLLSYKNFKLNNIGNVKELTIVHGDLYKETKEKDSGNTTE